MALRVILFERVFNFVQLKKIHIIILMGVSFYITHSQKQSQQVS